MAGRRATEIMENLKAALALELPSFTLTSGTSSGDLTLTVSEDATPATTEDVAFIKLIQRSYSGFPTISLASSEDGRAHVLQVAVEESATTGVSVWNAANWAKCLARLLNQNVEVELYLGANGGAPEEADITSSLLAGVVRTDPRHPNNGQ